MFVPSRNAASILGLHPNTLRRYAKNGKIEYIRNEAGQRRYNINSYIHGKSKATTICYCRVSSQKQKDDLARQIVFMQGKFPKAEILKDIGSGLNFKRKGLRTILERLLCGHKLTIIVAHRDRLTRFGFDLIKYMVEQNSGELLVLDKAEYSPSQELRNDLDQFVSIVFKRIPSIKKELIEKWNRKIKQTGNNEI